MNIGDIVTWRENVDSANPYIDIILPEEQREHIRILWNTGEIIIHLIPPHDHEMFEVIG